MVNQFHAVIGQGLRLKMQLAQCRQFKKADADIHGMAVKRLQQLIGAEHRDAVIKLRITIADHLEQQRQRDAALRHHADPQRAVHAMLQRLHFKL